MKSEDIDSCIGMPDIDAEWTKFEQEVIGASTIRSGFRMSRAAAIVVVAVGMSLTALASAYLLRMKPAQGAAQSPETLVPDTVSCMPAQPDTAAFFVFDNEEMLSIVSQLGGYYGLEPQFKDEEAKHVRLYARIKKAESIDEVTALLNNFKKVKLSVHDGRLIVASQPSR